MFLAGIVIILIGVVLVLAGIFTSDVSSTGQLEFIGLEVGTGALFVLGVVAGALVVGGLALTQYGARRGLANRRKK